MILFLKRHWISIGLLVISSIIGLFMVTKEVPVDIWRIEYEFRSEDQSALPNIIKADTAFQFGSIICRNLSSSISDTLIDKGIRRQELKIYIPKTSKKTVLEIGNTVLPSGKTRIINHRFQETQRNKRSLLYWVLFGFFLGIVVEFVIALKKKPSTR